MSVFRGLIGFTFMVSGMDAEARANIRMKLLFLLALFLTLPAFVSAETVHSDDLVIRNGLYYKKFTNVPFTGRTSGRTQTTFKDGKNTVFLNGITSTGD